MNCAWNELIRILPLWLQREVDRPYTASLQEIRLRLGKPPQLLHKAGKTNLQRCVTAEDLSFTVNSACRYSPWTATGAGEGYLTAPGGHRIGLCGEAVVQNGKMTGIKSLQSLNIRVARDFAGIGRELGKLQGSVLILGSPGSGKTTLLRDVIRQRSYKETVAVADERGELFPFFGGKACFDTGQSLDVMTGCSKAQALDILIRTMSPDTLAMDEITQAEDCNALLQALWCGVHLLATAHASSVEEFRKRPVYRPLAESGLFDTFVVMHRDKSYHLERGIS